MGINSCRAISRLYQATLMSCGTAKHVSVYCTIYIYIYIYIYIHITKLMCSSMVTCRFEPTIFWSLVWHSNRWSKYSTVLLRKNLTLRYVYLGCSYLIVHAWCCWYIVQLRMENHFIFLHQSFEAEYANLLINPFPPKDSPLLTSKLNYLPTVQYVINIFFWFA